MLFLIENIIVINKTSIVETIQKFETIDTEKW